MAEFLLELFSEEIPARFQKQAMDDLHKLFAEGLSAQGLEFKAIKTFVTPRRLGLVIDGLPHETASREEERKGPQITAPEAAIAGFLKSAGLNSLDQCKKVEGPKGAYWVAVSRIPAKKAETVLSEVLWATLQNFPWKKSQNWGEGSFRWVRPLRGIIALFDGKVLPYTIYLGSCTDGTPPSIHGAEEFKSFNDHMKRASITISNTTRGHRFMGAGDITVADYADYVDKLKSAKVILDREERKRVIVAGAANALQSSGVKGTKIKDDESLLEEVAGLTEWPVPLVGTIDSEFMDIPPEVLITTMRNNQKYFSVANDAGVMQSSFIITANLETADKGAAIIDGNERVLRARFSDAKFFWELDKKTTLDSRVPQLASIVFHTKLGTMDERVKRLESLAGNLATLLAVRNPSYGIESEAKRAAKLAKADLVTGMVGEFPELQGIMGGYYARHDGETESVARAVKEHYSPLGPTDMCPTSPVSVSVAMADKMDVLVGFFAIDEKPTGSKDPYALRRAALGILRLLIENNVRVDVRECMKAAYAAYKSHSPKSATAFVADEGKVVEDLCVFFADRLKAMLREKNVRHDVIDAVFGPKNIADIVGQMTKLDALQTALGTEDGQAVLALYTRAANILKIEEKKDKISYSTGTVDKSLLSEAEEISLQTTLTTVLPAMKAANASENYAESMRLLLSLRAPVDAFFDKITVNATDAALRTNRLTLISQLRDVIHAIADFSALEGA